MSAEDETHIWSISGKNGKCGHKKKNMKDVCFSIFGSVKEHKSKCRLIKQPVWVLETTSTHTGANLHLGSYRLRLLYFVFIHSCVAQLEKSVCMGTMLWSKAAYWESPVLASLSCCAAWESWNAASGWAESGSRVHSRSSRSATPFRSSQKPKAKAAFLRRFSSWPVQIKYSEFSCQNYYTS